MTLMASNDRTFELEIIDGTKPKAATGMTDTRLFNGGNRLHIKKDDATNFWSFRYDQGIPPGALSCVFTGFNAAKKHADVYYQTRNLRLKEIDG